MLLIATARLCGMFSNMNVVCSNAKRIRRFMCGGPRRYREHLSVFSVARKVRALMLCIVIQGSDNKITYELCIILGPGNWRLISGHRPGGSNTSSFHIKSSLVQAARALIVPPRGVEEPPDRHLPLYLTLRLAPTRTVSEGVDDAHPEG